MFLCTDSVYDYAESIGNGHKEKKTGFLVFFHNESITDQSHLSEHMARCTQAVHGKSKRGRHCPI